MVGDPRVTHPFRGIQNAAFRAISKHGKWKHLSNWFTAVDQHANFKTKP